MSHFNSPATSELNELISKHSSFLVEIKKRLIFLLAAFMVASIAGFVFYERIIRFLIGILSLNGVNVVFTSPFQFINLAISCGIASGLILVFPLIIFQILSFLKPALKKSEYNMIVGFLPLTIILFIAGFSFGIAIMKWQIQLFLSNSQSLGIGNILDITNFLSTVLLVSGIMGITFQFPIVLFLLMRIGVLKHSQMSKQRLWVYLGSFIFSILLPLDSILADVLITLPVVIMFETTLLLNKLFERRKSTALTI